MNALIDQEILQLHASIAALDRKRKRLAGRLPSYKLTLNPVRRLPNEILAYIFGLCLDEPAPHEAVFVSLRPSGPRWVVSQVCKQWRALAISLPQLWTIVGVNFRPPGSEMDSGRVVESPAVERLLSVCLQRARDKPLCICWGQYWSTDKLLSVLLSRSYQWKDARFTVGMDGVRFLSSHIGMFPNLISLCLSFEEDNWSDADPEDKIYMAFQDAPSLRYLSLHGCPDAWRILPKLLPWKQTIELNISGVNDGFISDMEEDCWDFLPLMENLRVWSLEMLDYAGPMPVIRLANLHTLILRPRDALEDGSPLLRSLVLPALKALRFEDQISPTEADEILSLIARSECRLEELVLFGGGIVEIDMEEYLSSEGLKWLTTLHLSGESLNDQGRRASVTDDIIDALRVLPPDTDMGITVPRLRKLIITGVKQWPDACLVDVLASRRYVDHFPAGSVARLEEISLMGGEEDGFCIQDPVAKAQLQGLIEGGLITNFS